MDAKSKLGASFRLKREALSFTQASLSRATGIPVASVGQWEGGSAPLDPEDVARLEWCLGQVGGARWLPDRLLVRKVGLGSLLAAVSVDATKLQAVAGGRAALAADEQMCVAAVLGLTERELHAFLVDGEVPEALERLPSAARSHISRSTRGRMPADAPRAFGAERPVATEPPATNPPIDEEPPGDESQGRAFRERRHALALSRTTLGRACGVSSQRIADHEQRGVPLVFEDHQRLGWCMGRPVGGDWMASRCANAGMPPRVVAAMVGAPEDIVRPVLQGSRSEAQLQIMITRLMGMHSTQRRELMDAAACLLAFRSECDGEDGSM